MYRTLIFGSGSYKYFKKNFIINKQIKTCIFIDFNQLTRIIKLYYYVKRKNHHRSHVKKKEKLLQGREKYKIKNLKATKIKTVIVDVNVFYVNKK